MNSGRLGLAILLVTAVSAVCAPLAGATTFTVSNPIADAGAGSLRQAILDANANGGTDDIVWSPTPGPGTFVPLQSVLPTLTESVNILGPGADLMTVARQAGGSYRIFKIPPSVSVTIEKLDMTGGIAPGGEPSGGGILNEGTLTLRDSSVRGNSAQFGGGILNAGTMTVNRTIITSNITSSGPSGAIEATGAGSSTTIRNSTISGNTANSANSAGGIATAFNTPALVIENSTVAGNVNALGPSNLVRNVGTVTVTSSILGRAGDVTPCAGTITSGGFNIDIGTTCGLAAGTDQSSTNPLLNALGDNGGPSETMSFPANSPAHDRGNALSGSTLDQRGLPRTVDFAVANTGDGTDVGAFELQGPPGDTDGDLVADGSDNCPFAHNPGGANNDGDAQGDICDADDDNDTVADTADNCATTANADQADNDGDAQGDSCDGDDDNDTAADGADNCALGANTDQADNDGDAQGDACDSDDDNDTVADTTDNCATTANADQANNEGDPQGDACDADDDNDTVADAADNCRTTAGTAANGCPNIARSLTLKYKDKSKSFSGKLLPDGACADSAEVEVFLQKSGPDKRIGSATTAANGTFKVKKKAKPGRYYATAAASSVAGAANCQAAESKKVNVSRR